MLTISYCQFHYVNLVLSLAFSLGSALHAKKWLQIATDSKAHVELMGTKIFFVDFWRRAEGAFVARLSRDPQKAICDVLALQWSGRTEQLHQQLNRDIVKSIFKLVWKRMETEKFKQHFITFLVAIRSKYAFDIDWPVPNKTY